MAAFNADRKSFTILTDDDDDDVTDSTDSEQELFSRTRSSRHDRRGNVPLLLVARGQQRDKSRDDVIVDGTSRDGTAPCDDNVAGGADRKLSAAKDDVDGGVPSPETPMRRPVEIGVISGDTTIRKHRCDAGDLFAPNGTDGGSTRHVTGSDRTDERQLIRPLASTSTKSYDGGDRAKKNGTDIKSCIGTCADEFDAGSWYPTALIMTVAMLSAVALPVHYPASVLLDVTGEDVQRAVYISLTVGAISSSVVLPTVVDAVATKWTLVLGTAGVLLFSVMRCITRSAFAVVPAAFVAGAAVEAVAVAFYTRMANVVANYSCKEETATSRVRSDDAARRVTVYLRSGLAAFCLLGALVVAAGLQLVLLPPTVVRYLDSTAMTSLAANVSSPTLSTSGNLPTINDNQTDADAENSARLDATISFYQSTASPQPDLINSSLMFTQEVVNTNLSGSNLDYDVITLTSSRLYSISTTVTKISTSGQGRNCGLDFVRTDELKNFSDGFSLVGSRLEALFACFLLCSLGALVLAVIVVEDERRYVGAWRTRLQAVRLLSVLRRFGQLEFLLLAPLIVFVGSQQMFAYWVYLQVGRLS